MTDIQDQNSADITRQDTEVALDGDGAVNIVDGDSLEVLTDDQRAYRFSRRLSVLSDPMGAQSSAVGALRNHLTQKHLGLGRRSLAICSVGDDVNRTLVSANLAIAAAQAGASTILVDANLRNSEFETFFTPPAAQPGLGDYLSGTVQNAGDIVRNDALPNLALIHAGTPLGDPQAALAGRRLDDLVAGLMRSYDFTIVDCPAARYSSDARRIASVTRYALIVVKRDVTYINDIKRLKEELTSDGVSVVGTFLNVS